ASGGVDFLKCITAMVRPASAAMAKSTIDSRNMMGLRGACLRSRRNAPRSSGVPAMTTAAGEFFLRIRVPSAPEISATRPPIMVLTIGWFCFEENDMTYPLVRVVVAGHQQDRTGHVAVRHSRAEPAASRTEQTNHSGSAGGRGQGLAARHEAHACRGRGRQRVRDRPVTSALGLHIAQRR